MIDFSTDPEFQEKLDWMNRFVREECETMDLLFPGHGAMYDMGNARARAHLKPLREQVKARGLWACHLGPHLGGPGYGQVKLALMNEVLGRSSWAPTVFGTAAPDTGNAEILAMFGTDAQKARYLQPLMDGDICSSFSMSEPQGGSDPTQFACRAWREGEEWVIEGEKWFISNARYAAFHIVMAVTDPDNAPHERMSMLLVDAQTPGIEILRNCAVVGEDPALGSHAYIRYDKVRVPLDAMLGGSGEGFKVAQARLGGGRIHHGMRTVGRCQRAIDMMIERAASRRTRGRRLGDHQFVQGLIADSVIQLEQFRLLVLKTAWMIDEVEAGRLPQGGARQHIAMSKVAMAQVMHDIIGRAVQLHGSLGLTNETWLGQFWAGVSSLAFADGPTDAHRSQLARNLLKDAKTVEGHFPSDHNPTRLAAARARYPEAA
jgi:acyl-CoA dehydrogenase